jgi:hypothetical protein
MLFTRLSFALLALSTSSTVLARSSSSDGLARRTVDSRNGVLAFIEKRDELLEADLEARAVQGLMDDLNELVARSVIPAEEHGLEKRGSCAAATTTTTTKAASSTKASSSSSVHAKLSGHVSTCSKAVVAAGVKIKAAVKKCGGKKASAASIVVAVKTEIVVRAFLLLDSCALLTSRSLSQAIRVSITALAKACVALKASGKGDLTVSIGSSSPFLCSCSHLH